MRDRAHRSYCRRHRVRRASHHGPTGGGRIAATLDAETLLESINDPVLIFDPDTRIILAANTHAATVYGVTREVLIGRSITEFSTDIAFGRERIREIVQDRVPGIFTFVHRRPDGTLIDIVSHAAPIAYAGRTAIIAVNRDVTAQKQIAEALQRQNAFLEALHETTLDLLGRGEPDAIVEAMLCRAGELVGTPHNFLALAHPGAESIETNTGSGVFREYVSPVKKGEGVGGIVWQTGRPVMINDYAVWEGRLARAIASGVHASLGVPLIAHGNVIGVLGAAHLEPGRQFTADDVAILSRFADLSAIVLEQAHLNRVAEAESAERQRAEASLRASEERYRHLVEAAPVAILVHRDGVCLYANPTAVALIGARDAEQLIGYSLSGVICLDPSCSADCCMTHEPTADGTGLAACRMIRLDGAERQFELISEPIMFDDAEATQTMMQDVTERLQAEAALRASEARFRALVEKSADITALISAKREITYAGPSITRILGYDPAELIGRAVESLIHPDDREWTRQLFGSLTEPGASVSAEYRLRHKDGSWHWIAGTSTNLFHDPAVGAVVANYRDVTEQKAAEAAVEASERRFRALVEKSADAITLIDAQGVTTYVGPSTADVLGFPPDELVGRRFIEFVHPDDREMLLEGLGPVLAEPGASVAAQYRLRRPDGSYRWMEGTARNLLDDPAVGAIVGNARDIHDRKEAEDVLRSHERQLRAHYDGIPIPTYIWQRQGEDWTFVDCNRSAHNLAGKSMTACFGWTTQQMYAKRPDILAEFARCIAVGTQTRREMRWKFSPSGECRDFVVSLVPVAPDLIVMHAEDVTDRMRAEAALRESEARYRSLVELLPDAVGVYQDGRLVFVNDAAVQLLGMERREDVIGTSVYDFVLPDALQALRNSASESASARQPGIRRELPIRRGDGETIEIEATNAPVVFQGEPATLVIFRNVSERKRAEEALRHIAFHDALAGLPNRAWFTQQVEEVLNRAAHQATLHYAVLFIDLNRFQHIDDSLGHVFGDALLVSVAERIAECIPAGAMLARLGGDEFGVLLAHMRELPDATRMAEQIHEVLRRPFMVWEQEIFVTVSIGIAVSTAGYQRPDEVLRDADSAMYRAKVNGGARHVIFDAAMRTEVVNRLQVENDLRRAIVRGELSVAYQPIVALATDAVIGVEALVRWMHPQRGMVPPSAFIPVAEETGLIAAIDRWVLAEASRQMAEWTRRYPASASWMLNVNISARHFVHPDLVEFVAETIAATGLPAARLQLEITESALLDRSAAIDILTALRETGVKIALDDFGVGYASLGYLQHFPLDSLKIDQSFLRSPSTVGENIAIIRAIVDLAHALGLLVVGEGIETERQRGALHAVQCDSGQGYLFAKPITPGTMDSWLAGKDALLDINRIQY